MPAMSTHGLYSGSRQRRHVSYTASSRQQPSQEHHTPPTYVDLFAGIGTSHLVLKENGLKCVYANEPDPERRFVFERNHASDMILDTRDINLVPLQDIPSHELLIAWRPLRQAESRLDNLEARRTRIFEIVRGKRPPIVLIGGSQISSGAYQNFVKPPGSRAASYNFAAQTTQELEALGYRSTFTFYDHAGFDLPLSRQNLFIVGVRADQNVRFEFKPPPRQLSGLGLHRCLLSHEELQQIEGTLKLESQLVDGVEVLQPHSSAGRIVELNWTNLDVLPDNRLRSSHIPLGFAKSLSTGMQRDRYLVPGPDGKPMQVSDSAPPPMLDWIVKALKEQFPHILASNENRMQKDVAHPQMDAQTTA
ncbi:cytosine-5-methyltransferase protein [Diaporthe amygdali]|uniref:cytosine-5-methyltransferase protein n=1 Tax=Phomopsis amygdali TaxID=1214568 RepID=UPI0022FEC6B9|nr:cytosine-5-methyltransferase protein [Diaporthe amygdali]KAJ0116848.1 cytosine-5-methyltransferase protein [Diaporthe amygdali]